MREGKGLVSRNMLLFDQRNTPLCHTHTNHVKRDRLHKDTFQSPLFFYHYPCLWYSIDTAFQQAYHHHIYIYIYIHPSPQHVIDSATALRFSAWEWCGEVPPSPRNGCREKVTGSRHLCK